MSQVAPEGPELLEAAQQYADNQPMTHATDPGNDHTLDRFLDGRVELEQPRRGQRAGSDTVFLAAAIPARPGDAVLEVGTGHGAALICLGARVPGLALTGIEIDPDQAKLASANARRNGLDGACQILTGDFREVVGLPMRSFDHAFANPPWFEAARHQVSGHQTRARARSELDDAPSLAEWVAFMAHAVKPGGSITLIINAAREGEIASAMAAHSLSATVLPLIARAGDAPKRVILRGRLGGPGISRLESLVLHGAGGAYRPEIDRILREAQALDF